MQNPSLFFPSSLAFRILHKGTPPSTKDTSTMQLLSRLLACLAILLLAVSAKPDYSAQARAVRSAGKRLSGNGRYSIRNLATGQSLAFQRDRLVNFIPAGGSQAVEIQVSSLYRSTVHSGKGKEIQRLIRCAGARKSTPPLRPDEMRLRPMVARWRIRPRSSLVRLFSRQESHRDEDARKTQTVVVRRSGRREGSVLFDYDGSSS